MALPLEHLEPDAGETFTPGERRIVAMLEALETRFSAIEATLEHYRPLLELADAKMNGPRLFGRGALRAQNQNTPGR